MLILIDFTTLIGLAICYLKNIGLDQRFSTLAGYWNPQGHLLQTHIPGH